VAVGVLGVNVEGMVGWFGVMKDFYVKVGRILYVLHKGRNVWTVRC
jgi:hypothetical protein